MLSDKNAYIGVMTFGILLNAAYVLAWMLILAYLGIRFFKISKKNILSFMKLDLNSKYRIFTLLFYLDFFMF